jgi:hypothetical protein
VNITNTGTFTMNEGTISGNTANDIYGHGGGVYVYSGTFTKSAGGGIIYGQNAAEGLKNTAGSGLGHAVYVYNGSKKRDNTAGTGDNLSTISGSLEGWD